MNALTSIAVANADVLRLLEAVPDGRGLTDLARALERDKSNVNRTLKGLAEANLVRVGGAGWQLAEAGRAALQAIARAETPELPTAGAEAVNGIVGLLWAQIRPDPLNPRRDFDSDDAEYELAELAADIAAHGLMQNLVVRAAEPAADGVKLHEDSVGLPVHRLISGERRYRAIGKLIGTGDWDADKPIPCQIVDTDDVGHRIRALSENLQRRNLNPLEEAKAYEALAELLGSTAAVAERVSVTQRQVQMRLQLLELSEEDQKRLTLSKDDPDYLSVTAARRVVRGETNKPRAELPPGARLALVELAYKIANEGLIPDDAEAGAPAEWAQTNGYSYMSAPWKALLALQLIEERMALVLGVNTCLTRLTPAGAAVIDEAYPEGVFAGALADLRREVGRVDQAPGAGEDQGYLTYTLNHAIGAANLASVREKRAGLTDRHIVELVEILYKSCTERPKNYSPWSALIGRGRAGKYDTDPIALDLRAARLICNNNGRMGPAVTLTDAALKIVRATGFNGDDVYADMRRAQSMVGWGARFYWTEWLDDDAPARTVSPPAVSADDEEADEGQPLLIPPTLEEEAEAARSRLYIRQRDLNDQACESFFQVLNLGLKETLGESESRWDSLPVADLAARCLGHVISGRAVRAAIDLMALIVREDVSGADKLLRGAAEGLPLLAQSLENEDDDDPHAACDTCCEEHPTGVLEDGLCPSCIDKVDPSAEASA